MDCQKFGKQEFKACWARFNHKSAQLMVYLFLVFQTQLQYFCSAFLHARSTCHSHHKHLVLVISKTSFHALINCGAMSDINHKQD